MDRLEHRVERAPADRGVEQRDVEKVRDVAARYPEFEALQDWLDRRVMNQLAPANARALAESQA